MTDSTNSFYAALGRVIDREGATFTPSLVVEEISRATGKHGDSLLEKTIEHCRELVKLGVLWFSSSYLYIKEDSCLTVNRLRVLRQIITGISKESPASP